MPKSSNLPAAFLYTLTITLSGALGSCGGGGSGAGSGASAPPPTATPAPTVSISASPTSVASGGSSNLSWSSTEATSCAASGAWSGNRATAGTVSTGPLTNANNTFTLTCTGPGGSTSQATSVAVAGSSGPITGLDFPGSAATNETVRFRFTNPLPIYPATYIWRVKPRRQNGYYTAFFWGNDGAFGWDNGDSNTYYGAHPYPQPPPNGSAHKWEISVGANDFLSSEFVVYDVWYTQVLRVWSDGAGKNHEFYWDWPNTNRVIRRTESSSYGNVMPPKPALTFGDAPWAPSSEIMNGVMRGIQIYSSLLTTTVIQAEIDNPGTTTAGATNIWYLNLNPTPTDISDQSGAGHNPEWVGSERPALWTGP